MLSLLKVFSHAHRAELKYQTAIMHHKNRDYEPAFKLFKKLADRENVEAQYYVGKMYRLSEGVAQDYDKAIKYLEKADGQGHDGASYRLGLIYESPEKYDLSKATQWYIEAAKKGESRAVQRLTIIYRRLTDKLADKFSEVLSEEFNVQNFLEGCNPKNRQAFIDDKRLVNKLSGFLIDHCLPVPYSEKKCD